MKINEEIRKKLNLVSQGDADLEAEMIDEMISIYNNDFGLKHIEWCKDIPKNQHEEARVNFSFAEMIRWRIYKENKKLLENGMEIDK